MMFSKYLQQPSSEQGSKTKRGEVQIYGVPASPTVKTVISACRLKAVPYVVITEGHDSRAALQSENHRALHPYSKMPAMKHGAVQLYESFAIVSYIDKSFHGRSLTPESANEYALMNQWVSVVLSYVFPAIIERLVFAYVFAPNNVPTISDKELDDIVRNATGILTPLELHLKKSEKLCGAELTIADLMLVPLIHVAQRFEKGEELMGSFPTLRKYAIQIATSEELKEVFG